jgi:hypothetical protein
VPDVAKNLDRSPARGWRAPPYLQAFLDRYGFE